MNWEPMTEEAVFEDGERVLIYIEESDSYHSTVYAKGRFRDGIHWYAMRYNITHFCRITNPNNPSNTTKEQTT